MTIAFISLREKTDIRSRRIALFFANHIKENNLHSVDLPNLYKYIIFVFEGVLNSLIESSNDAVQFSGRIKDVDGIIFVTPENNERYPESLRKAISYLNKEWERKSVTSTIISGDQPEELYVTTALVFSLWNIGVFLAPSGMHRWKINSSKQSIHKRLLADFGTMELKRPEIRILHPLMYPDFFRSSREPLFIYK